jgi:GDP-L-fucose synthase
MNMNKDASIFVAGHGGLVGSALVRALTRDGYTNLILRTRAELDLTDARAVEHFFETTRPAYVLLAAAKVGGIMANKTYPADFIRENLSIELNVITAAARTGVTKLLFLGSSCIYPREAPQPITEAALLTGPLEPTNRAYALAKIAGIVLCQSYNEQHGTNFISVMPTNLYGLNDNFDLETSHVLPAMIRRFHEAKERGDASVTLWGSGSPKREFLHVDDLADACLFLMNTYDDPALVNIGTGEDCSIKELAETIRTVVGYKGDIVWDTTKPDGTPRKLLDVSKLHALGWKHRISLEDGIRSTYVWYQTTLPKS